MTTGTPTCTCTLVRMASTSDTERAQFEYRSTQ